MVPGSMLFHYIWNLGGQRTLTHFIIMRSFWKIWIEAKAEDNARRVFERLQRTLERELLNHGIEPTPRQAAFSYASEWNSKVRRGTTAWWN